MKEKEVLTTEQTNINTTNIDEMSTIDIVRVINDEDKKIADAVEKELPAIAKAIDIINEKMLKGGRLLYVGAGTSGRLGVLDASECPPTFGVDHTLVKGIIAGGKYALTNAVEGAEDSRSEAVQDLREVHLDSNDVVCGIAASGRTPYVLAAIKYANNRGCETISVSCAKNSEITKISKYPIEIVTGAEVITGSTRMKAGTATKMVLNMLSTGAMIKLGKVYGNMMVDVQPSNYKLKERSKRILQSVIDMSDEKAITLLEKTDYNVKIAIIMELTGCTKQDATHSLELHKGNTSKTIKSLKEEER